MWVSVIHSFSGSDPCDDGLTGIPVLIDKTQSDREEFEFENCVMPGADEESRWFELDERCVSQVDARLKMSTVRFALHLLCR